MNDSSPRLPPTICLFFAAATVATGCGNRAPNGGAQAASAMDSPSDSAATIGCTPTQQPFLEDGAAYFRIEPSLFEPRAAYGVFRSGLGSMLPWDSDRQIPAWMDSVELIEGTLLATNPNSREPLAQWPSKLDVADIDAPFVDGLIAAQPHSRIRFTVEDGVDLGRIGDLGQSDIECDSRLSKDIKCQLLGTFVLLRREEENSVTFDVFPQPPMHLEQQLAKTYLEPGVDEVSESQAQDAARLWTHKHDRALHQQLQGALCAASGTVPGEPAGSFVVQDDDAMQAALWATHSVEVLGAVASVAKDQQADAWARAQGTMQPGPRLSLFRAAQLRIANSGREGAVVFTKTRVSGDAAATSKFPDFSEVCDDTQCLTYRGALEADELEALTTSVVVSDEIPYAVIDPAHVPTRWPTKVATTLRSVGIASLEGGGIISVPPQGTSDDQAALFWVFVPASQTDSAVWSLATEGLTRGVKRLDGREIRWVLAAEDPSPKQRAWAKATMAAVDLRPRTGLLLESNLGGIIVNARASDATVTADFELAADATAPRLFGDLELREPTQTHGHKPASKTATSAGKRTLEVLQEVRGTTDGLDAEVMSRIVRARHNELRFCSTETLPGSDEIGGELRLQVRLRADGKVKSTAVQRSTLGSRPFERCVQKAVKRWTFPVRVESGSPQAGSFSLALVVRAKP